MFYFHCLRFYGYLPLLLRAVCAETLKAVFCALVHSATFTGDERERDSVSLTELVNGDRSVLVLVLGDRDCLCQLFSAGSLQEL